MFANAKFSEETSRNAENPELLGIDVITGSAEDPTFTRHFLKHYDGKSLKSMTYINWPIQEHLLESRTPF